MRVILGVWVLLRAVERAVERAVVRVVALLRAVARCAIRGSLCIDVYQSKWTLERAMGSVRPGQHGNGERHSNNVLNNKYD